MHLQHTNAIFTDSNGKACCDRVIATVTTLAEHKAGLPADACVLLAKALKQMEYSVVTAYEPLQITNKHTKNSLLHGIGQGPIETLLEWTFNVDIYTKCYDKTSHSFIIMDPTQTVVIQCNAAQFVDDNKVAHNGGKTDLGLSA
eukprot:5636997-Ditylum_brightwellii.AAC.1